MDDILGALSAQIRGKDHPLLGTAKQADPRSSSMAGLIQKLEASQQRRRAAKLGEKEGKE